MSLPLCDFFFFFFNDTATTEIYTLSLHDALPICVSCRADVEAARSRRVPARQRRRLPARPVREGDRSEEHTSELQSLAYLVCRLLLEKKKRPEGARLCRKKLACHFLRRPEASLPL